MDLLIVVGLIVWGLAVAWAFAHARRHPEGYRTTHGRTMPPRSPARRKKGF